LIYIARADFLFCGSRAVYCLSSWLDTQQVFCRVGKQELEWF